MFMSLDSLMPRAVLRENVMLYMLRKRPDIMNGIQYALGLDHGDPLLVKSQKDLIIDHEFARQRLLRKDVEVRSIASHTIMKEPNIRFDGLAKMDTKGTFNLGESILILVSG